MKILFSLTIAVMLIFVVNGQGTRIYTSSSNNKNIGGGFKMGSFGGGMQINSIGVGSGGFGKGFGGYQGYQGGYGQGMFGGYGQGVYGNQQGYGGGYGPTYGMKHMMMKKHYMNKKMYY